LGHKDGKTETVTAKGVTNKTNESERIESLTRSFKPDLKKFDPKLDYKVWFHAAVKAIVHRSQP